MDRRWDGLLTVLFVALCVFITGRGSQPLGKWVLRNLIIIVIAGIAIAIWLYI